MIFLLQLLTYIHCNSFKLGAVYVFQFEYFSPGSHEGHCVLAETSRVCDRLFKSRGPLGLCDFAYPLSIRPSAAVLHNFSVSATLHFF